MREHYTSRSIRETIRMRQEQRRKFDTIEWFRKRDLIPCFKYEIYEKEEGILWYSNHSQSMVVAILQGMKARGKKYEIRVKLMNGKKEKEA